MFDDNDNLFTGADEETNDAHETNTVNDKDDTLVDDSVDDTVNNTSYNNDFRIDYDINQAPANEPKKNKGARVVAAVLIGVAIIAVIGIGIAFAGNAIKQVMNHAEEVYSNIEETAEEDKDNNSSDVEVSEVNSIQSTETSGVVITDVSDVVDEVMPSIVAITSETLVQGNNYNDLWSYFYGNGNGNGSYSYEETGAGSGIIVEQTDTELLIVTNNHVVDGADSLYATFIDEETVEGYVKGTNSDADLAIVSIPLENIKESTLEAIKKATLGDSDSLSVGEGVIAIGNALGYGQSVTTGVISAKNREITVDDNDMTVLQTDAAINGGNSGGALLNSNGEVIGINVAKYSSSSYSSSASVEGMGFAIPISSAKDIINDLMNRETRMKVDEGKQGYLGISGYDVSSEDSQKYSIPTGIYVYRLYKGGAAAKAGIEEGDIITKFDGQSVSSMTALQERLQYYSAGETVSVTISYRDGREYKEREVNVTLSDSTVLNNDMSSIN